MSTPILSASTLVAMVACMKNTGSPDTRVLRRFAKIHGRTLSTRPCGQRVAVYLGETASANLR